MGRVHVSPAGIEMCRRPVLSFYVGPEGETREPGDVSAAEQHLSTSGQSEQTPAVHLRFHPAVTETSFSPAQIPGSFQ